MPEPKDDRLLLRLSKTAKQKIQTYADAAKLSVSEFMRRRALAIPVLAKTDAALFGQLRQLGGLLKDTRTKLIESGHSEHSDQLTQAIDEILECLALLKQQLKDQG